MPSLRRLFGAALLALAATPAATPAAAGDLDEGWEWLAARSGIETQGLFWNDRLGDGRDRWKSGGLTQSYIFPERRFGDESWFADRASALELNLRGLVMTPDDTSATAADPHDRPYAQYAAAGLYLLSIARPRPVAPGLGLQVEDRAGLELGWQGDPLPLFDIQGAVHGMTGAGGGMSDPSNTIDGEFLANLEGRRTWRLHRGEFARDLELAPFVQTSLGMRENSLRAGADLLVGSALEGRTWGSDPATGAVMAGESMHRGGLNWTLWAGGDLGLVASDAFLDGGFAGDGPSVERQTLTARARAGILLEYGTVGIGFSVNWLGREFRDQPEGQAIGAVQLKIRF